MSFPKYDRYKESGVEWLGEVPEHWQVKSIKWLSPVQRGASPRPIEDPRYFDDDGEYAWVRIADVSASDGILYETTQKLSKLGSDLSVKINPGELFISIAGTVGKPCVSAIKACIHDGFIYFPSLEIDPRFLYRIFESGTCYGGLGKFGTQLNLNTDTIGSIRIVLPPKAELDCLLTFLDRETAKIDELIAEQQRLIDLLKEKRQAVISHAVTKGLNPDAPMKETAIEWLGEVPEHWNLPKIGHHAEVTKLTGFEYTNYWQTDPEGEIVALRGFNIGFREIDIEKSERISRTLSEFLSRSKLYKGDVVMPCTGTLGAAAVIDKSDFYHINQNIAKVRFDERLDPNFSVCWLTSGLFKKIVDHNNMSGMQPVLLIGDIRNMKIPLPPLKEQQEIITFLDRATAELDELIAEAQHAIALLQERRTALISAAVTGKIDVRSLV